MPDSGVLGERVVFQRVGRGMVEGGGRRNGNAARVPLQDLCCAFGLVRRFVPRAGEPTSRSAVTRARAFGGCPVLCLFCLSASWRAGGPRLSAGLSDHPFPSPRLAPGAGRGSGCCRPAVGRGARRVRVPVRPFPPPSLDCFIFLHSLGGCSPALFGLLK